MIRELHQQIAAESRDRAVLQWFAAKYGAIVLSAPLRGGFDNAAWIIPPVVGLTAFAGVVATVLRWTKDGTPPAMMEAVTQERSELVMRIRNETAY